MPRGKTTDATEILRRRFFENHPERLKALEEERANAKRWIATLSADGRVVIPKTIRKALGLRDGQTLEVALEGGAIVLRSVRDGGG